MTVHDLLPASRETMNLWLALRMAVHAGDLATARAALDRLEHPAAPAPGASVPPPCPDAARRQALMER